MSDWHTVRRWFGGRTAREIAIGVLVAIVAGP